VPARPLSVTLKSAVKSGLSAVFPRWATGFFSARARAHAQAVLAGLGCVALNQKLLKQFGSRVRQGPFAGLVLSPLTHQEHLGPYLLGTYEQELHPVWGSLRGKKFGQLLDVGSKFGYYAVGLAQKFPQAEVVAFDPDPWARRAVREMAAANGVANVAVADFCDLTWLRRNLRPGAFILSDCEGYEAVLFSEPGIPALASATMVIELHEQFSPGVTRQLQENFSATHQITVIEARPGLPALPPECTTLNEGERGLATNEFRTGAQAWLWLGPRG